MKFLIIIGAGGHGKVIAEIAILNGYTIRGFLDDDINKAKILDYPLLGSIDDIPKYIQNSSFVLGIGNNQLRKHISALHSGVKWSTLVHPKASIVSSVALGAGTVVMANAVINVDVLIGKHCIINTASVIEHDSVIKDYVHLSPGCLLGGNVVINEGSWLGIGSIVINNVQICNNCVVGAGAVVARNLLIANTYVGIPAKPL